MAEALKNYQKIIKEESAKLKKLVGEIKYYQLTIRNYEMEIQRLDKELAKQTQIWFDKRRRGEVGDPNNNQIRDGGEEEDGGEIPDDYDQDGEDVGDDDDRATPEIAHKLNSA